MEVRCHDAVTDVLVEVCQLSGETLQSSESSPCRCLTQPAVLPARTLLGPRFSEDASNNRAAYRPRIRTTRSVAICPAGTSSSRLSMSQLGLQALRHSPQHDGAQRSRQACQPERPAGPRSSATPAVQLQRVSVRGLP